MLDRANVNGQLLPQMQADVQASLWASAPAWRGLTVGACCLISAAIAAPYVLQRPTAATAELSADNVAALQTANPARKDCGVKPNALLSPNGAGRIVGFISNEQARKIVQTNEELFHATASPNYVLNQRVFVRRSDGSSDHPVVVALLPNMSANIGDHVEWRGAFADPTLPCHFAPPLAVSVSAN